MSDLQSVRDVLPGWVVFWAWFAAPVAMALLMLPLIWLTDRGSRYDVTGVHWTEVARRHFSANVRFLTVVFLAWLNVVALVLMANGELTREATPARVAVGVGLIWGGSSVCMFRRARRIYPWSTVRLFVEGQLLFVILFLVNVLIAVVMAVSGPDVAAHDAWMPIAFYGIGLLAMLIVASGGIFPVLRLMRLLRPADTRVQAIVDQACARTGTTVRGVWEVRLAMANAFALPITGDLWFTTGALEALDDRELQAITLHEIGHLQEGRVERWSRVVRVAPWLVLGCWRPIVAWSGGPGLVVSFAVAVLVAVLAHRQSRRLEEKADRHALDHEELESPGDYARALERLHQVNLMPAVMRGKRSTHPHLYDRMIASGVQPDYERPEPPTRPKPPRVVFGFLIVLAIVVFPLVNRLERRADVDVDAALTAIVVGGGDAHAIGHLGCHWREQDPDRAEVLLRFASVRTTLPEFPARLAVLLARHDPRAARDALERAERLVADAGRSFRNATEWERLLDVARHAVATAERR